MMKYAQDKSDLESPMYSKLIMLLILTILCDYCYVDYLSLTP